MKQTFCAAVGAAGAFLSGLLGGWDGAAVTLLIFMAVDYVSGLVVAGVFHASTKSGGGALESRAGFKGLCRKGMILLVVMVAARVDVLLGVTCIRDGVIVGFCANELLSIVENAGLMGLPLPAAVTSAVDVLTDKAEGGGSHGDS